MEIDIFPVPHRKDGMARNFDKVFLGILIITYIIAAFKTAQCIVGNDAEKEFVCFLLAIPIFVVCHRDWSMTPRLLFSENCNTVICNTCD